MLKPISSEKILGNTIIDINSDIKKSQFKESTIVIYKGQIPNAAIYISSGTVLLKVRNKTKKVYQEGFLLLFQESLEKEKIDYDVIVSSGAEIYWIDKGTLKEFPRIRKDVTKIVS